METELVLLPSFLFGLSSTLHCFSMCGPFVGVLNLMGESKWKTNFLYNFGRLSSYSLIGAIFGFLGYSTNITGKILQVQNLSVIFSALILVLFGVGIFFNKEILNINFINETLNHKIQNFLLLVKKKKQTSLFSYLMGFFSAILPCGMLYPAFAFSYATGKIELGFYSMILFFLGTLPGLLLFGFGVKKILPLLHLKKFRLLGFVLIFLGFLLVHFRFSGLNKQCSCHDKKIEHIK